MDHDSLVWRSEGRTVVDQFEDGGRPGYAFTFSRDDDAVTLALPASFCGCLLIVKARFVALSSMLGSVRLTLGDTAGTVSREVICQSGISSLAEVHEVTFESRGERPLLTVAKGTLSKVRMDSLSIVASQAEAANHIA
jgi:hypothetical protein